MKNKYYFPNLRKYIDDKGLTQEEFKQMARQKNTSPSYKGWSLLMKEQIGMTLPYANKAKNILKELKFDDSACEHTECSKK